MVKAKGDYIYSISIGGMIPKTIFDTNDVDDSEYVWNELNEAYINGVETYWFFDDAMDAIRRWAAQAEKEENKCTI